MSVVSKDVRAESGVIDDGRNSKNLSIQHIVNLRQITGCMTKTSTPHLGRRATRKHNFGPSIIYQDMLHFYRNIKECLQPPGFSDA